MDLLSPLNHWHWWILGVALGVAELFVPGIFFIWVGAAAAATGVVVLVIPGLDWKIQVLVAAALSVLSALAGRRVYGRDGRRTDHPALNRRGEQYVGQVFTLAEPIVNGAGRLHVADTMWKVSGPDCPAGTRVTVVGAEGVVLRVEVAG